MHRVIHVDRSTSVHITGVYVSVDLSGTAHVVSSLLTAPVL